MRTREKRQIKMLIFNLTPNIFGVLSFDFFFYYIQLNQPGGDDHKNNQQAQKNSE
jgi:hypothetical protein